MSTNLTAPIPQGPGAQPYQPLQPPVPIAPETAVRASPDWDDAALEAARREVAVEDGTQPAGQPIPQPAPGPQPQAGGQPIMIPKERFDEVLAQARAAGQSAEEWKSRALYMEGALTAVRTSPPATPAAGAPAPAPTPQPAGPTVEQQILAAQAELMAAAAQFDNGSLTMADYERQRFAAGNKISGLREQGLYRAVLSQVPAPQPGIADAQMLDQATANLEERHPWCATLREYEWAWLESWAVDFFAKCGAPIVTGNTQDAMKVRALCAQLTDVIGPWLFPSKIATIEAQRFAARQTQPAVGTQPSPLPAAPQPPAAIQRFAAHPPNMSTAGSQGAGNEMSEDRINLMSTEEIASLPDAVRARYL